MNEFKAIRMSKQPLSDPASKVLYNFTTKLYCHHYHNNLGCLSWSEESLSVRTSVQMTF